MADFKPNYSELRRVGCFNFGTLEYKFGRAAQIIEKRLKTISLFSCPKATVANMLILYKRSWTLSDA